MGTLNFVVLLIGLVAMFVLRKPGSATPLGELGKGCLQSVAAVFGLLLFLVLAVSWQAYRESGRIPFVHPADCTDLPEQTPETALAALRKKLLETPKAFDEFITSGGTMAMFEQPTLIVGYQRCPPQPYMRFFIEQEFENRPSTPWFFWGPRQWHIGVGSTSARPCAGCADQWENVSVSALISRCGGVWEMRVRKYTTQCAPPPATPKQ